MKFSAEINVMPLKEILDPQGKAVVATESATGGSSSASGIATSMGGAAHKPTSGVPKKLGNAHKPKKVTVGKGIY